MTKKLREAAQKFPVERDKFLAQMAEKVLARVKKLTPEDTGNLNEHWGRSVPAGGSVEVYNNTEYASFV